MEQDQPRSGFWTTLPGILTGMAALISAGTGGYLALNRGSDKAVAASAHQAQAPAEAKPLALVGPPPADAAPPAEAAPPRQAATGKPRPAFNCALAATSVETMICSDVGLAQRDRQVATEYFALRGRLPPGVRSQLQESQRHFLDLRNECTSSECLAQVYDNRLHQLSEFASN